MQRGNDFSQGSIPRTIVRLSLPMIGAQIVNALYNIVDRIYIGQMPVVGRDALTGLGLTFPILMIISAFAALAGMGGAPLCSIYRGQGDDKQAEDIMGNSLSLLLIFGVALTMLGLVFKGPALYLFGASDITFPYADNYLTIYLSGSIFVMIGLGMNYFISAQGFAKESMFTVLIGAALNIALDPVFIFALDMGVQGAALATVLSQMVSAVWCMGFLLSKRSLLKLRWKSLRLRWGFVKRICALGFSSFTMQVTESAVQIVSNASLQAYGGDIYVGVMTVVNSIKQVLMMPLQGFAQGAQPVIGFNYGAKKYGRVTEGCKFLMVMCIAYSVFSWALALLFPGALIRVFNSDPSLLSVGIPAMRIYFLSQCLMGLQMAAQNSFVALNKPKEAMFFALLRKGILLIPLMLIMPKLFGLGAMGIFVAEPIADAVSAISCFTTFMLTAWRSLKKSSTVSLQP